MVTSSLYACQAAAAADTSSLLCSNSYGTTTATRLPPFDGFIPQHVTTDFRSQSATPTSKLFEPLDDCGLIGTATDTNTKSTTTVANTEWIASIPRGGESSSGNNGEDGSRSKESWSIVEEILASPEDYYHALGLKDKQQKQQHYTLTDIKKAYRRRAVQTHPDKTGGDRRAFDIVAKAYEVLSHEETRAIYDKFGVEGLNGSHTTTHHHSSFQDFFQSMFHPSSSSSSSSSFSRNRTVRYQLQVSLEDLYRGTTQDIWVTAPGTRQGKTVQVHIPRGTVGGQPIVMSGAMDFASTKGVPPGDLIFVITPSPHPVFTRKNHDLAMELTLSLEEALCGFQRTITHLDGTTLEIASAVEVHNDDETPIMIAMGDVQVLKGKGFPKGPHGDEYGDLYIQFRVDMPKPHKSSRGNHPHHHHPLNHDERQQLRQLLEKLQGKKSTTSTTTTSNTKINNNKKSKRRKEKSNETMPQNNVPSDAPKVSPLSSSSSSSDGQANKEIVVHRLQVGKSSDFGRATGIAKIQRDDHHDDHHHDDDDDEFLGHEGRFSFPFGSGTSTFFQHSSGGGPSRSSSSFYFGSHPHFFGQGDTNAATDGMDDGIPPQCQQM